MLKTWTRVKVRWWAAVLVAALAVGATAARAEPDLDPPRPVLDVATPVGPLVYTPGRGLHVGDTNIVLGGYATTELVREEGKRAKLGLADLSLFFIWDPLPRVQVFAELEGEDLVVLRPSGGNPTNDAEYVTERLYADLAIIPDRLTARLGKFLTPVGRWNVIHAQPLVWTSSRPVITLLPFDQHTTGIMLGGTLPVLPGRTTWSAYGQFTDPLDASATDGLEQPEMERGGGGRLEWSSFEELSVGASYLAFLRGGRWRYLTGLDGAWHHDRVDLLAEFAHEANNGPGVWGLYLQAAVETIPRVFVVGRYEYYARRREPDVNLGVTGLAWRPLPYLVGKVEYVFASHRLNASPPGFRSSFSILF